jgi:hypothetical protein
VPRSAPHFKRMFSAGQTTDGWESFHWTSEGVVEAAELEAARAELDPIEYASEYLADFVTYEDRAYYTFSPAEHCQPLPYQAHRPLIFSFDFNVEPATALVMQEQLAVFDDCEFDPVVGQKMPRYITSVIGEVWIPRNGTVPAVCRRLRKDWARHVGEVFIYGDPSGGNRTVVSEGQSAWDEVKTWLGVVDGWEMRWRWRGTEPKQRPRVNAVNAAFRNAAGQIHCLVDPKRCPRLVEDLESMTLLEGGSGELDKKGNPEISHLSDELGYYLVKERQVGGKPRVIEESMV